MAHTGVATRTRSARTTAVSVRSRPAWVVRFVFVWWALIVFEPDRFLAAIVGGPWYRLPAVLGPVLLLFLILTRGRRVVYWPLAAFVLLHAIAVVYAENRGFIFVHVKLLLYMVVTSMAALGVADAPSRVVTLMKMYLLGFAWYGVQGIPYGLVWWHHELANEDSFGPLMGIGFGYAYYFALATRSRAWRATAYTTAAVCCFGVVASFARGAVLSFVVVLFVVWLRSPNKLRAIAGGAAAALVTLVAINVIYPQGQFWSEMETISEGNKAGTGMVRWVMWSMALDLWKQNPILGIGAGNFGPVAAMSFENDPTRTAFADVATLWGQALHSSYIQILCEQGIVGALLFGGMTLGIFRRGRRLRTAAAVAAWRRRGGRFDLRCASLAIEMGIIGFLCNGLFYNQLYVHWYWTLLSLSLALNRSLGGLRPAKGRRRREGVSIASARELRGTGKPAAAHPHGEP